jgi:hypothetical protein
VLERRGMGFYCNPYSKRFSIPINVILVFLVNVYKPQKVNAMSPFILNYFAYFIIFCTANSGIPESHTILVFL